MNWKHLLRYMNGFAFRQSAGLGNGLTMTGSILDGMRKRCLKYANLVGRTLKMDIEVGVAIAVAGVMVGFVALAYAVFRDRRANRLNFAIRLYWVMDESSVPHSSFGQAAHNKPEQFPSYHPDRRIRAQERLGWSNTPQYLRLDDSLPFRMEPRAGRDWERANDGRNDTLTSSRYAAQQEKRGHYHNNRWGEIFRKMVEVELRGIVGEEGYLRERMEEAKGMQD